MSTVTGSVNDDGKLQIYAEIYGIWTGSVKTCIGLIKDMQIDSYSDFLLSKLTPVKKDATLR